MIFVTGCGSSGSKPQEDDVSRGYAKTEVNNASDRETETSQTDTQQLVSEAAETTVTVKEDTDENGNKILIAFFSRADENYDVGIIEKGNTQIVAEMINDKVGGELFHIETVNGYPVDYDECTDVAKQEQRDNARPELTATVADFDSYDTVFLGYPIWWGDMPMAVYTFLESYDFSGKTIIPFCTHEGSGLSETPSNIHNACPHSTVLEAVEMRGKTAQEKRDEAKEIVDEWLNGLDY